MFLRESRQQVDPSDPVAPNHAPKSIDLGRAARGGLGGVRAAYACLSSWYTAGLFLLFRYRRRSVLFLLIK